MEKKKLNNKVEFTACGKSITMRLSDKELNELRCYSIKNGDWEKANSGDIYNFSLYALFDYDIKSPSKRARIFSAFPYHDFNMAFWYIL